MKCTGIVTIAGRRECRIMISISGSLREVTLYMMAIGLTLSHYSTMINCPSSTHLDISLHQRLHLYSQRTALALIDPKQTDSTHTDPNRAF